MTGWSHLKTERVVLGTLIVLLTLQFVAVSLSGVNRGALTVRAAEHHRMEDLLRATNAKLDALLAQRADR